MRKNSAAGLIALCLFLTGCTALTPQRESEKTAPLETRVNAQELPRNPELQMHLFSATDDKGEKAPVRFFLYQAPLQSQ